MTEEIIEQYNSMFSKISQPTKKLIIMTKSTFAKTKAQIKSYQYYLFWGACTFAVMAGQIFVGAGYQSMSNSVKDLTEIIEIKMEWDELDRRRTSQSPYNDHPDDYIIWETID